MQGKPIKERSVPVPVTVVVLAGGQGTRMYPLTQDRYPKHLHKIAGKELIARVIEPFGDAERTILMLHTHAAMLSDYLKRSNTLVDYWENPRLTNTVAEFLETVHQYEIDGDAIIAEGDSIRAGLDLHELYNRHIKSNATSTIVATSLPLDNATNYHGVNTDAMGRVVAIRQPGEGSSNPFPVLGLVLLSPMALKALQSNTAPIDSWSQMLECLYQLGGMYASIQEVNYFNINTPEQVLQAEGYLGGATAEV